MLQPLYRKTYSKLNPFFNFHKGKVELNLLVSVVDVSPLVIDEVITAEINITTF
jgi:hypothetical protein